MEDQQPGSGDLTAGTDATRRRRFGFPRLWRKAPVADPAPEPESARPTPVGKTRRTQPAPPDTEPEAATSDTEPEAATSSTEPEAATSDTEPEAATSDTEPEPATETASAEAEAEAEAETEAAEVEPEPAEGAEPEDAQPDPPTETEAESEDGNAEAAESEDGAEGTEPEDAEPEPILVEHRPAGRRLLIAAAVASVLFVGAAGFAGAMLQPYVADRALVHTKMEVARTATDAITALWSYTPEDMESLPNRAAKYLGGDFATEYRRYIDAIIAANKQAEVTNTTQVMGAAVESISPTEATAIVYTNSVSTSPVTKNIPSLRYLAYKLDMEREGTEWLITNMSAITKLDLTPQL